MGATPRKRFPETQADRYARIGPTGFLKPVHLWDVMLGTERVHHGRIKRAAQQAFNRWKRNADETSGRASGKPVSLLCDGKRISHHQPKKHDHAQQ